MISFDKLLPGRGRFAAPIAAAVFGLGGAGPVLANSYAALRAADVARCEAIDPREYRTGMVFNPEGHRSLFVRSACFQDAAVKFRDESLCAQVKQRQALFSSSWGYSARRCRQLVGEGVLADRGTLGEIRRRYLEGAVTLRDFRVERNGNGRDYDVIPVFDAGYSHGYSVRFEFVAADPRGESALLAASGFHLKGDENIRLFVRQSEIRQRFARFEPGRHYRVRATVTLDVGYGGQGGMWSEAFIARVFPAAERTRSVEKEVSF